MPYSTTSISGVSLKANGETFPAFGSTVPYGRSLGFLAWISLASDAPGPGTLTLQVDVTRPDTYQYSLIVTQTLNPGDGSSMNVGIGTASQAGQWTATITLTGPGTPGTTMVMPFWTVEPEAEEGIELGPGSYLIQVTTTNLSTSGGVPVEAMLDTKVEIFTSEWGYVQGWTSRNPIPGGGSKVNNYSWDVSDGWVGQSGFIKVSVLDPNGNELASTRLNFVVI